MSASAFTDTKPKVELEGELLLSWKGNYCKSLAGGAAKELTAAALRKLLKTKPLPNSSGGGADALKTHIELIECATSDVVVVVPRNSGAAAPAPGPGGAPAGAHTRPLSRST